MRLTESFASSLGSVLGFALVASSVVLAVVLVAAVVIVIALCAYDYWSYGLSASDKDDEWFYLSEQEAERRRNSAGPSDNSTSSYFSYPDHADALIMTDRMDVDGDDSAVAAGPLDDATRERLGYAKFLTGPECVNITHVFSGVRTQRERQWSQSFKAGPFTWAVTMMPPKMNGQNGELGLYCAIPDFESLPAGWKRCAVFRIRLFNWLDSKKAPLEKCTNHKFSADRNDWGWRAFMAAADMSHAVEDGWVHQDQIKVELSVRHMREDLYDEVYADSNNKVVSKYNSKQATGFVGIVNQGATCYMNSLLQSLFHVPYFRRAVFKMPTDDISDPTTSIPLALQRLFYRLQHDDHAVLTQELTASFGWSAAETLQQQDVQELDRVLLERLDEKMRGSPAEGTVDKLFKGMKATVIGCTTVDYRKRTPDPFYDLSLDVRGCANLVESFRKHVEFSKLDGLYDTGEHGKQEAEVGSEFDAFPAVLHLHLKRFMYDPQMYNMVKVHDRLEFPDVLDLSEFLSASADRAQPPPRYLLHSVMIHSGSGVYHGHYYAFIRASKDKWLRFDDTVVKEVPREEAVDDNFGGKTLVQYGGGRSYEREKTHSAYMLVYVREADFDNVMQPVQDSEVPEHLHQRFREEKQVEKKLQEKKHEEQISMNVHVITEGKLGDVDKLLAASAFEDDLYELKSKRAKTGTKDAKPGAKPGDAPAADGQQPTPQQPATDGGDSAVAAVAAAVAPKPVTYASVRIRKIDTMAECMQRLATELGVDEATVAKWNIWLVMRDKLSKTHGPATRLTSADVNEQMGVLFSQADNGVLFVETSSARTTPVPPMPIGRPEGEAPDKGLLVFRAYDYRPLFDAGETEEEAELAKAVRYMGCGEVDLRASVADVVGYARELCGYNAQDQTARVVVQRQRSVELLSRAEVSEQMASTVIGKGNSIVVEKVYPESTHVRFRSALDLFEHLSHRCMVTFVDYTDCDNEAKRFDLLLNTRMSHREVINRVAEVLKVAPTHVRFYQYYSGKPYGSAFVYEAPKHGYNAVCATLGEMLRYLQSHLSSKLVFEVTELPVAELNELQAARVVVRDAKGDTSRTERVLFPHNITYADACDIIAKKLAIGGGDGRRLRAVDVWQNTICAVYADTRELTLYSNDSKLYVEEIPEDQLALADGSCIVQVVFFERTQYNNSFHSSPFFVVVRASDSLADVTATVKRTLGWDDVKWSSTVKGVFAKRSYQVQAVNDKEPFLHALPSGRRVIVNDAIAVEMPAPKDAKKDEIALITAPARSGGIKIKA